MQLLTLKQQLSKKPKKIDIIDKRIIVAGSGEVGKGQRFQEIIEQEYKKKLFTKEKTPLEVANHLSHEAIKNFSYTFSGTPGPLGCHYSYGAVVAFPLGSKLSLVEFAGSNFQPEMKGDSLWFVSLGNGQKIADTFLAFLRQVFWQNKVPSKAEGIFAAVWTIQLAIDINAGGINEPVQLAVLTNQKGQGVAELLSPQKISEHLQYVKDAKSYLSKFKPFKSTAQAIPEVP